MMGETTVYIVEEFKNVVDKLNTVLNLGKPIQYMFGHPVEISNRLQDMTESVLEQDKKFPLIILFTDITIHRDEEKKTYGETTLRVLIANITEKEYISPQRLEFNFKPILHPIKAELINQIKKHKMFSTDDYFKFNETEMYFYGSMINNKNVFKDYIDAIELSNIHVVLKNKPCLTNKTNF